MPFMVIDGHNMKMDNNAFDTMGKFNVLSKQTQNAFHLSRLWDNHIKQNKLIKIQEHEKVQTLSKLLLKRWTQTSLQVPPKLNQ